MFVGTLDGVYDAVGFSDAVEKGLSWLRETNFEDLEDGPYELDGKRLVAIVQSYCTKPEVEGFWEAHRKFTDIQYLISGCERFGYAPIATLTETSPYDESKDLHKLAGEGSFIDLRDNLFVIAEPCDAHMPQIMMESPEAVRKVVIKVATSA